MCVERRSAGRAAYLEAGDGAVAAPGVAPRRTHARCAGARAVRAGAVAQPAGAAMRGVQCHIILDADSQILPAAVGSVFSL